MPADDLIRLTATEAVARLKRREIRPLELIDAAERRIAEVEPAVNALPTLCLDRARDHAKRIMAGEGAGTPTQPGWLAGLPVTIKDLTDVAGVRTTYGSPIFSGPRARHVASAGRAHRALGGIVIGKSNTPEFGAGGSTFNEVFGRTRNPWNTVADLRRLDRRRRGVAGDRRGAGWRTARTMAAPCGGPAPIAASSASGRRRGG